MTEKRSKWILFLFCLVAIGSLAYAHEGHQHNPHHHDHHHGHNHGEDAERDVAKCPFHWNRANSENHDDPEADKKEYDIWMGALQATGTITVGGNAVILLFLYAEISDTLLKRMVSFGVGGLLGDVFLHLIPHAVLSELGDSSHDHHEHLEEDHHHHHSQEEHDHHHDHDAFSKIGLAALGGILVFFTIEKLLQLAHPHSHSHGTQESLEEKPSKADDSVKARTFQEKLLQPGVLLNLVADFAHNFTDGLALAAAFRFGEGMGFSMTLAVTLHEIPHEIGDFAVLLNQGMSKKAAFLLQFVSALGALAGCLFGLMFSSDQPGQVLAFTGGGFVYVALSSLIPDLTEKSESLKEIVVQVALMSAGIYSMVLVGEFEESSGSHSH